MENHPVFADSVNEFCRQHGFSRATFYNLLKAGRGPRIMKVNGRTLISREAGAEFRQRLEVEDKTSRILVGPRDTP